MALDPGRRPSLHAAKLRGLSRAALGLELTDATGSAEGALGRVDDRVVCLVESAPERSVGKTLASMKRHDAVRADLLCADGADLVARRAACFDLDLHVHAVDDTTLSPVDDSPDPMPTAPPGEALSWIDTIERSGADVVVEHGLVTGEVAGLEVARVIEDEFGVRLEVGVSADDRIMFSLPHGHLGADDAMARIIEIVREHRRPGAIDHPLNRLSRSRWLRSMLVDRPRAIGMSSLSPAPAPVPRANLKDVVPAAALGMQDDREVVVAVSTGVDLDVVPFGAHARRTLSPDAELVIVVPERDAVPFLGWAVDRLHHPARVVTVSDGWSDELG